jgi:predicted amidohydrolase YtcJ
MFAMRLSVVLALWLVLAPVGLAATLVHNVSGYTLHQGRLQRFAALEFDAGRVTRLYSTEAEAGASKAGTRVDGGGATLLPGLIDAHGHIAALGRALGTVDLVGSASESEAARRVAAFAARNPGDGWLLGRGWNQVLWPGKSFPARAALDAAAKDRPVALARVDGHALWVNSAALAAAGIDANTPDPAGGQIVRDNAGEPTGVLIDNAMLAVQSIIPEDSVEQRAAVLLRAMRSLAAVGMTSTHDAFTSPIDVQALRLLRARGEMPVRVYGMLDVLDPGNDPYLAEGPLLDPERRLEIRAVKISSDGALGSRGAALFEDYSDMPGHRGLLLLSDEQLEHHIGRAMAAGFQVNTHAIGDRANDKVLGYYEALIRRHDSRHLRHRIEHAQILRPADLPRLARAGIIASVQPTHATSDKNMAADRLGEERLAAAYAWKQLLDSGAQVAGGSDYPVESSNPFYGLHAAVTRQDHDNQPVGGWLPRELVSREQALAMFTEGAAYAAHQEDDLGSLMPGYLADFILVREDYFTVAPEDIWKMQVLSTWVAGEQVHAEPLSPEAASQPTSASSADAMASAWRP